MRRIPEDASPGMLRRAALMLGFDMAWAKQLVEERPEDIVRWASLGRVPPEEDPRR